MDNYTETNTVKFVQSALPIGREMSSMARHMERSLKGSLHDDKIRLKSRYGVVSDSNEPLPVYVEAFNDEFSLFYMRGLHRTDLLIAYISTDNDVQIVGGSLAPLLSNELDGF